MPKPSATSTDPDRTLGILGGMSWVSTQHYYELINKAVHAARGRQHSASLVVASVDFQPIVDAQVKGDWDYTGEILAERARGLERAGAGAFLIASNTMHMVYEQVRSAVAIPGLDIFDVTAAAVKGAGFRRVGLLGTRYTMSHAFYREAYARHGIEVVVPEPGDARRVNEIIFRELIHGDVRPASAAFYRGVVQRLAGAGAKGVILGCTEIGLLLQPGESEVPLFDTTRLHAAAGAAWLCTDRP